MLYRDLEPEFCWKLPATNKNAKQKLQSLIEADVYGATIKKDGEYLRLIYDNDGEIWILGRNTKSKTIKNLKDHLPFLSNWLKDNYEKGTCIIGELYVPGKTSRSIRAYTGSLIPKSLKNQKDCPPTFYIFDVWAYDGISLMDSTYEKRIKHMKILQGPKVKINPQIEWAKMIEGSENIIKLIEDAFEAGEEGVVLVDLNSTIAPGKRTAWKSVKIKKEFASTIDCFFTGNWRPPTREYTGSELENWKYWENIKTNERFFGEFYKNYLDGVPLEPITKPYYMRWPGSLEVGVYKGKEIFPICFLSGLSDEFKSEFISTDTTLNVVMRPIAITGMEATDQSIRHPKFVGFRDDLNLEDCTYEKIFDN